MSRYPMVVGACLIASFLHGCAMPTAEVRAAQPQSRVMRSGPPDLTAPMEQAKVTIERLQLIQKSFPLWRKAVVTPGFQCVLDAYDVCHVTITVFQGTDVNTGVGYCIAIAPEFVILRGKDKPKQILWELQLVDPKTSVNLPWASVQPTGSTLDFLGDADRGILVLQNIYENHNPNKPQLKDGKRGKPMDPSDKTKFTMKNDHKENGTATYLPVVVHTENGQVSLCGTPDPLIYNVN